MLLILIIVALLGGFLVYNGFRIESYRIGVASTLSGILLIIIPTILFVSMTVSVYYGNSPYLESRDGYYYYNVISCSKLLDSHTNKIRYEITTPNYHIQPNNMQPFDATKINNQITNRFIVDAKNIKFQENKLNESLLMQYITVNNIAYKHDYKGIFGHIDRTILSYLHVISPVTIEYAII